MAVSRPLIIICAIIFCTSTLLWHSRFLQIKQQSHSDYLKELNERERKLRVEELRLRALEEALEDRERQVTEQATKPAVKQTDDLAQRMTIRESDTSIPCPVCGEHGRCNSTCGSCVCDSLFFGRDCSIQISSTEHGVKEEPEGLLVFLRDTSGKRFAELVTVVIDGRERKSVDELKPMVDWLKQHVSASLLVHVAGPSSGKSSRDSIDRLNSKLMEVTTPLTLLIGPDVDGFDSESNLVTLLTQFLTTDVDVLGFMTLRSSPLTQRHLGGDADNVVLPQNLELSMACHDIKVHNWLLRHFRPPYGYTRHQRFVAYCDRTSNSFMARTALLQRRSFRDSAEKKLGGIFNVSMGNLIYLDFFLRLQSANDRLTKTTIFQSLAKNAPTRVPGYLLVGTCAESLIQIKPSRFVEQLTPSFAEQYQIELMFDQYGRRSKLLCVKSGGIYGHSTRGLYSPLCHRLQRQRDFMFLTNKWLDSSWALPAGAPRPSVFGVSLHHGNLFGALRLNSELHWETDGDIDLIAFNLTHQQLLERYQKLEAYATSHGFTTEMTYPEKPWYISFKRDKTDFQLNARSVLDPQTRGKPPQKHQVSIAYQGRQVFMNGFRNPWRSIRSDPGHDYRSLYLAQQGWVLHFTKKSVNCLVPGHPACLPDCNNPWSLLDHNRCTDPKLDGAYRDPLLLFDTKPGVHRDAVCIDPSCDNENPDVAALVALASGERRRWEVMHNWQYHL